MSDLIDKTSTVISWVLVTWKSAKIELELGDGGGITGQGVEKTIIEAMPTVVLAVLEIAAIVASFVKMKCAFQLDSGSYDEW